jgi:hypothetical protein
LDAPSAVECGRMLPTVVWPKETHGSKKERRSVRRRVFILIILNLALFLFNIEDAAKTKFCLKNLADQASNNKG